MLKIANAAILGPRANRKIGSLDLLESNLHGLSWVTVEDRHTVALW